MARRETTIDWSAPLIDCEEKPSAIAWPLPVDRRLDELVEVAREFGERTTRKELAAAALFDFEADGEGISQLLRRYRRAKAGDAVLAGPSADNVLRLPRHKPGPRSRAK